MKVHNLPEIIRQYFEKIDQWGIPSQAIERLSQLTRHTILRAREFPEHISVATAQKIINAIQTWSNLQIRAIKQKPVD